MDNKVIFNYLRPISALFVLLTAGGAVYLAFTLLTAYQGLSALENGADVKPAPESAPVFDLKDQPDNTVVEAIQGRDLFSAAVQQAPDQQVPAEQLPPNLKVVAIMIAGAPQIVIEDTNARQTYFVSEGKPEGGIALQQADRHHVVIDYQGQRISLPVTEPTPAAQQMVPTNVQIP